MLNNFCVFEELFVEVFFDLWILDSGFRIPDSGSPGPSPRRFSKWRNRPEKTLVNAELTALLIGPFIPTR